MTDVLKELVALAEKATPGPWNPNREGFAALAEDNTVAMRAGPHSLMVGSVGEAFSNVEFACAARNAIPALKALLSQQAVPVSDMSEPSFNRELTINEVIIKHNDLAYRLIKAESSLAEKEQRIKVLEELATRQFKLLRISGISSGEPYRELRTLENMARAALAATEGEGT